MAVSDVLHVWMMFEVGVYQVNLRYGVKHEMSRTGVEKDTCTACAGTMILEFSALSRYTGDPVFEVCLTLLLPLLVNQTNNFSHSCDE